MTADTVNRYCLVLIDDNPGDLRLLQDAFMECGAAVEIVQCKDAFSAYAYLQLNPDADLILSDVNMPAVDGVAVMRWVRAQPALSAIPVVLMSSARFHHLRLQLLPGEEIHFLEKGSTWNEYLEIARNVTSVLALTRPSAGTSGKSGADPKRLDIARRLTARMRRTGPTPAATPPRKP